MTEKHKIIGRLPVLSAILGNLTVTILKFIAFFLSGSGAMFSEAIHSVADTSNQTLLAVGLKRSKKMPDEDFLYGYGNERFFWALISACGIFFLGAGITLYKGVHDLTVGAEVHFNWISIIVLIVSFIIESVTFCIAIYELKTNHGLTDLEDIWENGDPSTLAVLLEDGVALLGVLVAFTSILLSFWTGKSYFDAIGSIIIGCMLAIVAIILISKNREYLIGKAIPEDLAEEIIEMMEADPAIEKVLDFKSTTLDVGIYRIKCDIEFNGYTLLNEIYHSKGTTLREDYDYVKDDYEEFKKFCAEYADRLPRLVGKKIDDLENTLKEKYPGVKYIDIELN